jgi:hypothetical protein
MPPANLSKATVFESGVPPDHCAVIYLGEQEFETAHGRLLYWKNAKL